MTKIIVNSKTFERRLFESKASGEWKDYDNVIKCTGTQLTLPNNITLGCDSKEDFEISLSRHRITILLNVFSAIEDQPVALSILDNYIAIHFEI